MPQKPLNIGLVGYGFMGRTHSNAYKRVNDFFDLEYRPVLKAVCGRTEQGAKAFAEKWQYESTETDWRKLLDREDIDAIDICTPNDTHAKKRPADLQVHEPFNHTKRCRSIVRRRPITVRSQHGQARAAPRPCHQPS